jgi:uncharacterized SAM-binding protein YcdF (DUF218 family)
MVRPRFLVWAKSVSAGILIFLIVAAIRWQAVLTFLGGFLIDSQPPQQADLVLVLGGNFWGPRVVTGAELVRLHYAPLALLSGPPYRDRPEGEFAVDFLVAKGYPRELFQVFGHHASSTIGEANALRGELVRRKVKRVLLVTSAYHSRRAEIVLTLFCPGTHFISIPAADEHYHADQWWNDQSSRQLFFSEWSKILGSVLVAYPVHVVSRLFGRGMATVHVVPTIAWPPRVSALSEFERSIRRAGPAPKIADGPMSRGANSER